MFKRRGSAQRTRLGSLKQPLHFQTSKVLRPQLLREKWNVRRRYGIFPSVLQISEEMPVKSSINILSCVTARCLSCLLQLL